MNDLRKKGVKTHEYSFTDSLIGFGLDEYNYLFILTVDHNLIAE